MLWLAKFIATGAGTGYSPVAPGTAGSALGLMIAWLIFVSTQSFESGYQIGLGISLIIVFCAGMWAVNVLEPKWGKDPSKIVVDEVIGIWISLLFVPFSYLNLILAFVLFRLFDIWKPVGIRKVEKLEGSVAVILDDILAGILTNVCLQILIRFVLSN